jgi:TonB family protein
VRFSLGIALVLFLSACSTNQPVETIDKDAIREAMTTHLPEIRRCYAAALSKIPGLAGKLVIEWDCGNDGQVIRTQILQPVAPELDDCIVESLRTWRFPKPPTGVTTRIQYPFLFSP